MPFNVGPIELLVILVMLGVLVVVVVLAIRALTTIGKRVCPVCGSPVKRGLTTCATCQHDFAAPRQP